MALVWILMVILISKTDTMYLSHMSDLRAAVFSQSVTCDCKSCLDQNRCTEDLSEM